jgi:ribosomal protein L11 methyltransferase
MTLGSSDGSATRSADRSDTPDDGTSAAGTWYELSVAADHEAVEAVSEILSRRASGGVSVEPAYVPVDDGFGARIDPTRPAVVRAYVPALDAQVARLAIDETRAALDHLAAFGLRPIGELEIRMIAEEDWADAWKRHFPVLRIGRRVVIRPTWRRYRRRADDVVIALDPGMAFGTGLHPTTRLCLAELEALADEGGLGPSSRVLDVGCGSGILGIAAGLLGAGRILGLDTDPIAVEATLGNARRNRIVRRVRAHRGSLPSGEPPFDVVLANLVAGLLVDLADGLRDELRVGGTLVASGIFVDRETEVREAFEAVRLRQTGRRVDEDWIALRVMRGG